MTSNICLCIWYRCAIKAWDKEAADRNRPSKLSKRKTKDLGNKKLESEIIIKDFERNLYLQEKEDFHVLLDWIGEREKKNEGIKGKPVRTDYNEVLRWIFLFFFLFSHLFYPSSDPVAAGSISWQPKTKPKREVTSIVLIKVTDGEKKNQRGHQRKKRSTLMTCCSCVSKLGSFTFQGSGGIGWVLDPETRFFFLLNLPQPQNTKF